MKKVGLIPGLFAFLRMLKARNEKKAAADGNTREDPITALAKAMHPDALHLIVTQVREENATVKTYRLASRNGALPLFKPGQYLSIKLNIGQTSTARAYTISSAPYEADDNGYYEITIRHKKDGFVSPHIFSSWEEGTEVDATGPHGDFFYQPLRDNPNIIAIAGGTGITPFVSMLKQFACDANAPSLTLIYGCCDTDDILFEDKLKELCSDYPERFRRFNTFEKCESDSGLRKGFITAEFIRECIGEPLEKSFFICGPEIMYEFLAKEFARFPGLEYKQTRYELGGMPLNTGRIAGFPKDAMKKNVMLHIKNEFTDWHIPASTDEPILVAIERAGIILDSRCRSGECGICRSKLISGDVFIIPDKDGRRAADKALGYIHPCSTYPLSDGEILIPPGRPAQT
ncbi:MAG: 1,2-phenylacetyl-CoA epoxidase, subunit E [Firmicutes bacterium ADurb.Bin356]|nr:MAG: 1,2-phenylacetyl-CoA epoxidase, subunit E [Firmicutes bacterium ADurb.Bin356]